MFHYFNSVKQVYFSEKMSDKKKHKVKKASRLGTGADRVVGGPADLPLADLLGEVLAKAKQIKNALTSEGSGRDVYNKVVIEKL